MKSLRRGPDEVHGFCHDGQPYQLGWATAETELRCEVKNIEVAHCNPTAAVCVLDVDVSYSI